MNRRAGPSLLADLGLSESDDDDRALFDIKMVTTDKANRRSGLGTDLIRRSVQMAREMGYAACKTEATGTIHLRSLEVTRTSSTMFKPSSLRHIRLVNSTLASSLRRNFLKESKWQNIHSCPFAVVTFKGKSF